MANIPQLTVDRTADAAYLRLGKGKVEATVPVDPAGFLGQIVIDLDRERRLVGIEILDASRQLTTETIASARSPSIFWRALVWVENRLPRGVHRPDA